MVRAHWRQHQGKSVATCKGHSPKRRVSRACVSKASENQILMASLSSRPFMKVWSNIVPLLVGTISARITSPEGRFTPILKNFVHHSPKLLPCVSCNLPVCVMCIRLNSLTSLTQCPARLPYYMTNEKWQRCKDLKTASMGLFGLSVLRLEALRVDIWCTLQ